MPTMNPPNGKPVSQIDKFKQAAREAETDDSEATFDATLKHIAKSLAKRDDPKRDRNKDQQ